MVFILFDKNAGVLDKLHFSLSASMRISLVLAGVAAFIEYRLMVLFLCAFTLFLTYMPAMIERRYHVYLPVELELMVIIFLFASLFLGSVHGYYTIYWWWDLVLHTGSGIVLGLVGFMFLFSLYESGKLTARPITIAVFSFCFSVALGAIWEIIEFAIDNVAGLSLQHASLNDTMWDLIVDSIGAFLISGLGFFYIRGKKTRFLEQLLNRFVTENPLLFGKKKN